MTRYEFYNNLELFNRSKEITEQEEKDKRQTELNELKHYGTLGQKWGVRKWQNPDGTFNEAGKERYFGTGKFKPVSKEEHEDKTNSKVNEIYKNYKPNEWNAALNQSNLSNEEWWKIKKELNKKLYTEDKKYSKIVNDENVKNALQEYLNTIDDTHKEEQRIYSEEFRKSNPKAENFDGDGTEFWYEFANKDIVDKSDEAYWNLREAVSKNSYKNGKWDYEILDKVMSDINEIVEKEQDSNKIYNALKENTGADFRNNDQKIGGLFSKKNKSNIQYQNEDGSLTEEGKQFYATHDEKDINKNLDMKKYNAWKDEMKKGNIFDDEKKLDKLTKELGLPEKGEYKWEDDVKTVLKLRKDLYNTIEGNKQLSDNSDNIVKLVKAKENNNEEEYKKILDNVKDSDKAIVESFVNDINKTKEWYKEAEETMKDVNTSQTQNIKKYMENIWGDPKIRYDNEGYGNNKGKVSHPGTYDLEEYSKGNSKAAKSIKELDKNADAHFDKILDKLYNNLMDFSGTLNVWDEDHNKLTKSEFKDYMKDQKYKLVNSGSVSDNGNINLYLNDADLFWGHSFGIDYNPVTGEFHYRGIEG